MSRQVAGKRERTGAAFGIVGPGVRPCCTKDRVRLRTVEVQPKGYGQVVAALPHGITEAISDRPMPANADHLTGNILQTDARDVGMSLAVAEASA